MSALPTKWMDDALCRQIAGEYYPDGHGTRVITVTKAVCRKCPVISDCRDYALARPEKYGIWGGMSENERREVLRARRRGEDT